MSSIHYKFKSSSEYSTVTFDGPNISLNELRDLIMSQKKIAKTADHTLEITNAQSKEGKKHFIRACRNASCQILLLIHSRVDFLFAVFPLLKDIQGRVVMALGSSLMIWSPRF